VSQPFQAIACDSCGKIHKLDSSAYVTIVGPFKAHYGEPNPSGKGHFREYEVVRICSNSECLATLFGWQE
jgi:hypothetical protein